MSVTFDGIVSGFDTTALINAITGPMSATKQTLEAELDHLEKQREKVAGLSNELESLSDVLEGLSDPSTFIKHSATSEDSDAIAATAGDGAVPGTYTIDVTTLAQAESEASQGFDDKDSSGVIQQGTFKVTYAGVETEITIDGTNDSLEGLATSLNDVDGIQAYVLDTGEASTPYRLVVQGEDTGAANTLSFDTTGLSGSGTAPIFSETVTAQDATFTINGISAQSSSNSVTNLPGLTLDLKSDDAGPIDITVARDDAAMEAGIQGFIDAYNEVVSYYNTNTVFNPDENIKGALVGDTTVGRVMDGLSRLISDQYSLTGTYGALSEIGILTMQDGQLELDSDTLQKAFDTDLEGVRDLFTDSGGPGQTLMTQIDDVYVDDDDGMLQIRTETIEDTIESTEDAIAEQQERITTQQEILRNRFNAMEQILASFQSTQGYLSAILGQQGNTTSS